jgi:alkylation response protein AidB-like acyl-CoA dehydrogenase
MAALEVVLLLGIVFGLTYVRVPVLVWTIVIGLTLLLMSIFGHTHFVFLAVSWILYLAAAGFANLTNLRQRYFTKPLVAILEKQMPPISDTEREAIEAGNVWWEKDLFSGRPHWKQFLSTPQPTLTAEEQSFLDNQVETLCTMLNDWEIVNTERNLPDEVWEYLKKERFFGMVIPKTFGGLGFSALAHSTIVVKIATRSVSAAVNTMVPNSLGPGELLLHYGTTQQKNYYLPRLAQGLEIPCFALTGPEAGSDAGAITDTGVICRGEYDGKETICIRLSWDKRYITLAPVSTLLGIAFRLYDPDHLLGNKEELGITLCLVPTSHPGVEIGNRHFPLQLAFMNGPTRGKDVFIPLDWIIGGVSMAGQGWRMLMECLSIGRSISLPALSTACGKVAYRTTGAYARLRRQFNTSIANFEGVEEALGNIGGLTYLTEACRIMTAGAVDLKIKPAIASAIAKYHMTEMSRKIIAHSMDIHAGHGIQAGPRNFLANLHMAIPVSITVEGANILTRNLIIFGQGAIRCHPYILKEINLFSAPESEEKIQKLDRLLLSHIGYMLSNLVRTLWGGLTGGLLIPVPVGGPVAGCYRQVTRMSSALALLSDISMMILGGALKRKERISARLGDMLSQLYLASAVLKYFNDHGKPASDVDYVKWSVEMCLYETQVACEELLNNFPMKWVGKILHWIIFPYGRSYKKPSDILYHKIVKTMLTPSALRDRLTQHCFIGKRDNDPVLRLDTALMQMQTVEPLWKKLQKGIREGIVPKRADFCDQVKSALKAGIITEEEANALNEFSNLHKEVIKVNEFTFDLNTVVA